LDRPSLVIIAGKHVRILELTIPGNHPAGLEAAKCRKESKYQPLICDLQSVPCVLMVSYHTLGHYQSSAVKSLRSTCPSLSRSECTTILDRAAVSCSHHTFRARLSSEWDDHKALFSSL
jgi:hypothetical protein